jgi:transcriptional regulator with PAS, ATPase and Fis domain
MAAYSELIGDDASIRDLRTFITRVARSPAGTVLIYGETGTGKGLVARLIHRQSSRAGGPFIDVNCSAIPAGLMESELFGHERGAFTGAQAKKTGLVEAADGGTIFLDEIREMEQAQQVKLLSLLDTQRFRRVGAVVSIEVDVRFIAATNRILLSEVKEGRFREDLYYRLQVVAINIPPLRERGDDVLILADHFLRKFNTRYDRHIAGLEPAVKDIFRQYSWPGNVRELENLLERIFILEDEDRVLVRHLPARILRDVGKLPQGTIDGASPRHRPPAAGGSGSTMASAPSVAEAEGPYLVPVTNDFHAATERFQETLIRNALTHSEGNQSRAARSLGLSRHALRHYMLKLGIR